MLRSDSPRRPATAPVAALVAVLALLFTLPGAAAAAERPAPAPTEERNSWMGSTIVANEGGPAGGSPSSRAASVEGVDVSSHQGNVDWAALWNSGVRWAYVKATEGDYYKNEYFTQQYTGSYNIGMIRGAYHFANPSNSSGATQANYFAGSGGGWSADGKTLPGVLDIEYNPYDGNSCYDLSRSAMINWIRDFLTTYKSRTGRDAVIYTTTDWWTTCTGNYSGFAATTPLWIARYASAPGTLPAGWSYYTFWQYTSTGPIVGDHNRFNGAYSQLQAMANG